MTPRRATLLAALLLVAAPAFAACLLVVAQQSPSGDAKPPAEQPKPSPEDEANKLLAQAQECIENRSFPNARACLQRIIRQYPTTLAASSAKALLKQVPNERGYLLLDFEDAVQLKGANATWMTDKKAVPEGIGAASIHLKGAQFIKFPIAPQDFVGMRAISFWLWSESTHVGMTGAAYFCLFTNDKDDYLEQKFQIDGDKQWKIITLYAGGFRERSTNRNRQFTAVGFGNPSPTEERKFIVDDIRFTAADRPKQKPVLNTPQGSGTPPPGATPTNR